MLLQFHVPHRTVTLDHIWTPHFTSFILMVVYFVHAFTQRVQFSSHIRAVTMCCLSGKLSDLLPARLLKMGMSGGPFGQQYGQSGVQQMGAAGVNAQQLQNKATLSNNLPQFPTELKGAGSVPNLVSVFLDLIPVPGNMRLYSQYQCRGGGRGKTEIWSRKIGLCINLH